MPSAWPCWWPHRTFFLSLKGREEKKIVTLLLTFMVAMGLIWCACGELSFLSLWNWNFWIFSNSSRKKKAWQPKCKQPFFFFLFFFVVLILQAKTDVCSWNNWELVEHCSLRKYLNYSDYISTSVTLKRSAFHSVWSPMKKKREVFQLMAQFSFI